MTDEAAAAGTAPAAAPSALLTFLLADIRGYTHFAAERGDQAAGRLSETFLSICRDVVAMYDGDMFGSAGDQALAAFPSAHRALRAALDLQARLAREQRDHPHLPLVAGIGLDTGEGVRVGDDYRSNAINLAARLCALAGPGEIFASETVLLVARVVEGVVALDRGAVQLKGLDQPVRVIQLFPEGAAPGDLAPLQPILVTRPTNLPDEPTPFIGREQDVRAVRELVSQPSIRLVTLTGPGGTGKTRLALQVGMSLLHTIRHGVFFVDLAPLADPSLLPSAIGSVLDVREEPGTALLETLAGALSARQLLLVLDNFEHLLDASSDVATLLDRCRELRILVTSRIPLHLSREYEYAVSPLSVPDPARLPDLEDLSRIDAVALFVDRARAARHDFALSDDNAAAVAAICSRLDGLPLALELAAARIKLFPPQALLQRLDRRLALLTGGAKDRPTRQQTLRNTIDWSYSLLTPEEQSLFARLSVFSGGCTFEEAEAICNADGSLDVLEGMASLVDKSLVRQGAAEEPRFLMLETIRDYAAERLTPEAAREIGEAHARFFRDLAEEADVGIRGPEQKAWLDRLNVEHDNLRSALPWLLANRATDDAVQMVGALWRFWWSNGHWMEGAQWIESALGLPGETTWRPRAITGLANLEWARGKLDRAEELHREALQLRRESGDILGVALSLNNLAVVAEQRQELETATRLYDEGLEAARSSGDRWTIALLLGNLGGVLGNRGLLERAAALAEESRLVWQDLGDRASEGHIINNLVINAIERGDLARASALQRESLAIYRDLGSQENIAYSLEGASKILTLGGNVAAAARLIGAASRLRDTLGQPLSPIDAAEMQTYMTRLRDELGESYEALVSEGAALEDPIGAALEILNSTGS